MSHFLIIYLCNSIHLVLIIHGVFCSFSLLAQRKRTKRKGTRIKAFFAFSKNQKAWPKFSPGFQKFLTPMPSYAEIREG